MVDKKKEKFPLIEGFNVDIDNLSYHNNRTHKSSSALKLIRKNPRLYHKTYVLNEETFQNSSALAMGTYTHTAILEPHLLEEECAVYTGYSRRGKQWEEFQKENEGKTIITNSQKSIIDHMLNSFESSVVLLGHHGNEKEVKIASFFEKGNAEETLVGTLNDYPVKVRFDYRREFEDFASINDLKTTGEALETATVKDVEEICATWDYDLSAALYVDMAEKYTGKKHDFYFCFISKKDFATRIFKASENMLRRGRGKYQEAIKMLKEAESTGTYYKNVIEELR
jgi:hypothetical protein